MVGRVFRLPVDNMDDKDGFSERIFVLFVTMFAKQEAGSWKTEPPGEGAAAVFSAPWSFWAMPLIGTYCPINEFSLQRFI